MGAANRDHSLCGVGAIDRVRCCQVGELGQLCVVCSEAQTIDRDVRLGSRRTIGNRRGRRAHRQVGEAGCVGCEVFAANGDLCERGISAVADHGHGGGAGERGRHARVSGKGFATHGDGGVNRIAQNDVVAAAAEHGVDAAQGVGAAIAIAGFAGGNPSGRDA